MRGHLLMDGKSEIEVTDEWVTIKSTSGGFPMVQTWHRAHADQMAAEYFDKLIASGKGPPALLACFVNGKS